MIFIPILILIAYLAFAISKVGIPKSISDTFYQLDKGKWLFTISLFLISFTTAPVWFAVSPVTLQPLVFFGCAGLLGVGAAPYFKNGLDRKVHVTSTIICAAASVIWSCLVGYWLIPLIAIIVAILISLLQGNKTFWLEIAAFCQIYITILLMLLV